ncbi:hypothetical protein EGW08_013942, partial [Elysia chlorotica]
MEAFKNWSIVRWRTDRNTEILPRRQTLSKEAWSTDHHTCSVCGKGCAECVTICGSSVDSQSKINVKEVSTQTEFFEQSGTPDKYSQGSRIRVDLPDVVSSVKTPVSKSSGPPPPP